MARSSTFPPGSSAHSVDQTVVEEKPFDASCHADDRATARLHNVAPHDVIGTPVGAFHQDVRLNSGNHRVRRVFVEHAAASTLCKDAMSSARSASGVIGRVGPLLARTERSELTPTINASPSARASLRYRIWPGWRRSNTPFVKTTRPPVAWTRAANADTCCRDRTGKLTILTDQRCGCRSETSTGVEV